MDRESALEFIYKQRHTQFYQPVIFEPDVIEIRGKWHEDTKKLAGILLQDIEGKSVLDVGCSYGFFLHEAKRQGAKTCVGIDHDVVMMRLAREINEIIDDGVILLENDAKTAELDKKFDLVLMLNIMHVFNIEPQAKEVVEKYLRLTRDLLVISHDRTNTSFLDGFTVDRAFPSPRCNNMRQVTIIKPCRI